MLEFVHARNDYPWVNMQSIPIGHLPAGTTCENRRMDKYEQRRLNLIRLRDERCDGTAAVLARKIGVAPDYLSRMLYPVGKAGKKRIGDDLVIAIDKAFGLEPGQIDRDWPPFSSTSVKPATIPTHDAWDNIAPLKENAARKLPLISWVSAGMMCEAEDPYPIGSADDWILSPFEAGPNAFLLTVEGESMYNSDPDSVSYRHGDVIHVEPGVRPSHGDDVIARTPDGKATFKRYKESPDGPYLEAANPAWPNRIIRIPEGTVICGVVLGSWRRSKKK